MNRTRLLALLLLFLTVTTSLIQQATTAYAQEGRRPTTYYSSGIVHLYPIDRGELDPWLFFSAPHVYKTLLQVDADGKVEPVPGYTVASPAIPPGEASRISTNLAATLAQLLWQEYEGSPTDYYHVAIAEDLSAVRCGPAELVEGENAVAYYYNGRLLFAAIKIGHDDRTGLDIYAYFSLQYDGSRICSDRLVDGADAAVLLLTSILIAVLAFEGFRYSRKSLEAIFPSEAGGTL